MKLSNAEKAAYSIPINGLDHVWGGLAEVVEADDITMEALHDYVESLPDDPVKKPSHYQLFKDDEVIDVIRSYLTEEEFRGYCKGNVLKYRLRAGNKDSLAQDMGKAYVYQQWEKEI
jgi:hypothetical protein